MPNRPQIIQPLDVQIARAVTRVIRGHHPGRVPDICAAPVTSSTGQAALVADVYQEWSAGASPAVAQDVSVLFGNANGPGNPRVQAILKACPTGRPIWRGTSTPRSPPTRAGDSAVERVRSREENSCGLGYRLCLQSWAGSRIGTGFPALFNRSA